MNIQGNSTAYYQKKFVKYQDMLSKKQIENYEASGKSFEKLKMELGVEDLNLMMPSPITHRDIMNGNDIFRPDKEAYTVVKNEGLNTQQNSISLVPGVKIQLGNSASLEIKNSNVGVSFSGNISSEEQQHAYELAHALDRLIKYANGQSGSFGFDTMKRNQAEGVLKRIGIDTSKSFIVNGTEFNTSDYDRIEKTGVIDPNLTKIPEHQMKKIFESYGFVFD